MTIYYRDPKTGRISGKNGVRQALLPPSTKFFVFVYGTLKQGLWNNRCLMGARLVGKAHTVEPYVMFSSGVPFVVKRYDATDQIAGEVYEVDYATLHGSLDRLEGYRGPGRVDNMYERVEIDVELEDGRRERAFIYLHPRSANTPLNYAYTHKNEQGHIDWQPEARSERYA